MKPSPSFSRVRTGLSAISGALAFLSLSTGAAQVGEVRGIHDPSIAEEDGVFYVFSTGTGKGDMIPVHRSRDLYRWEFVGRVFSALPAWASALAPRDGNIWAPDISRWGGEFHLYYCVSSFGTNHSAIGHAVTRTLDPASPEYRWIDRGKVIESVPGVDDWNAIDPNVVLDPAGAPWLAFGSYWSGIKLRRLDDVTGKLSPADSTLYSLASRQGNTAIEAAFLFRSAGYYYLFVSFDTCCRGSDSTYKILVGRARTVKGPFVDRRGCAMLEGAATLVLESHANVRGPGHCAVLSAGGREWLVHHFYDASEGGIAKLQIRPLYWGEDGWPLAGEPLTGAPRDPVDASVAGTWLHSVDFADPSEIRIFTNGRTNDPRSSSTWSQKGDFLRLRWPSAGAPDGAWLDECVLAADRQSYVGRNQVDVIVRGHRSPGRFVRGDSNGDGSRDLSDAVFVLNFLFQGTAVTSCLDALDCNDDGVVDIADAIFELGFLFNGGPAPPPPRPGGGLDPSQDLLSC